MRRLVIIAVLFVVATACSEPAPGTVGAAHARVVAALASADAAALHELLDSRFQTELTTLYETLTNTVARIDSSYPRREQEGARRAAGAALVEGLSGPEGLFLRLVGEREPQALSRLQELGAGVSRVVADGELTRLTTRAGDVWTYRQETEGDWRWVPSDADREMVRLALAQARTNAERVEKDLARLRRFRGGVVKELP